MTESSLSRDLRVCVPSPRPFVKIFYRKLLNDYPPSHLCIFVSRRFTFSPTATEKKWEWWQYEWNTGNHSTLSHILFSFCKLLSPTEGYNRLQKAIKLLFLLCVVNYEANRVSLSSPVASEATSPVIGSLPESSRASFPMRMCRASLAGKVNHKCHSNLNYGLGSV